MVEICRATPVGILFRLSPVCGNRVTHLSGLRGASIVSYPFSRVCLLVLANVVSIKSNRFTPQA